MSGEDGLGIFNGAGTGYTGYPFSGSSYLVSQCRKHSGSYYKDKSETNPQEIPDDYRH